NQQRAVGVRQRIEELQAGFGLPTLRPTGAPACAPAHNVYGGRILSHALEIGRRTRPSESGQHIEGESREASTPATQPLLQQGWHTPPIFPDMLEEPIHVLIAAL